MDDAGASRLAGYAFHVTIHARPAGEISVRSQARDQQTVNVLCIDPRELTRPFPITWEAAADLLQQLPRLYFEPDGSFVWVSDQADQSWQVDGQVNDLGGRLLNLEVKGCCPAAAFDQLLQVTGWPQRALVFELVQQGLLVDETTFRQLAQCP